MPDAVAAVPATAPAAGVAARMPFVVGLTGGIGSGKSAAADDFAALGAVVIDTDVIAHELTGLGGGAMPAIRAAFGEAVVGADGALDRAAMRALAFADAAVRADLEAILHPMIRTEAEYRVATADFSYAVLVVPLLVETGAYAVDRVAVVDCPDETRIARVMARSGLSRTEIVRIMVAQAGREQRLAAADDVINNAADRETLRRQVAELDRRYRVLAQQKAATG